MTQRDEMTQSDKMTQRDNLTQRDLVTQRDNLTQRVEVAPGPGTVIRFGGIVAWIGPSATGALVTFLAESARNLGPSAVGGRRIADHLSAILSGRDPEPDAAFAVVGPNGAGSDVLLHGPVQARDGERWLYPSPAARWVRYEIPPGSSFSVSGAGYPLPATADDRGPYLGGSMMDLEAGVVPGGGFLLITEPVPGLDLTEQEPSDQAAPAPSGHVESPAAAVAGVAGAVSGGDLPPEPSASATAGARDGDGGRRNGLERPPVPAASLAAAAALAPRPLHPKEEPAQPTVPAAVAGLAAVASADTAQAASQPSVSPPAETPTEILPVDTPATEILPAAAASGGADLAQATESGPETEPAREPGPQGSLYVEAVRERAVGMPSDPLPLSLGPDLPVLGTPVVAGDLCQNRHLNRPGSSRCLRCRVSMSAGAQRGVSGARPPLGSLIVGGSQVYGLDRSYLLGSDPGRDPTVRSGLAVPLVLEGTEVSAAHAEIRLHNWDVAVTDRASATGTAVFEPSSTEWLRLRPFDPRIIESGTRIKIGGTIIVFIAS
jgi:hypothetical protein